jgi:hypothetical protein
MFQLGRFSQSELARLGFLFSVSLVCSQLQGSSLDHLMGRLLRCEFCTKRGGRPVRRLNLRKQVQRVSVK